MFTLPINEDHSLLSMRFPQKLWKIVNECSTGAIQWSKNGKSVLLDYTKFQRDYLDSKLEIFKTTNITSFIRQLNLYGFRKVTGHYREPLSSLQSPDIHEFRNENFVRGRYDLLSKVSRKTGIMKHRTAERKRSIDDASENESGKSRLVLCQKALTDALNNAALQQEKNKQHYADDNESVLSDFSGSQDSDWDSLEWLREPSAQQSTSLPANVEDGMMGCSAAKQHAFQHGSKALQASLANDSQSTMSSLLDPSISPQQSLGATASDLPVMDCPFTLEYVMQQMDSSLTEKIYEMLMEEEAKPEMILPDTPCNELGPPAKKGRMESDLSTMIIKSEKPDDYDQPGCSSFVRHSDTSSGEENPSFSEVQADYMYKDQILPCVKQEPQVYYEHEYNAPSASNQHSMSWNHYPPHRTYYSNLGNGHYMY